MTVLEPRLFRSRRQNWVESREGQWTSASPCSEDRLPLQRDKSGLRFSAATSGSCARVLSVGSIGKKAAINIRCFTSVNGLAGIVLGTLALIKRLRGTLATKWRIPPRISGAAGIGPATVSSAICSVYVGRRHGDPSCHGRAQDTHEPATRNGQRSLVPLNRDGIELRTKFGKVAVFRASPSEERVIGAGPEGPT